MKTFSAFIVMMFIALTLPETLYGGSDKESDSKTFSQNSIQNLINGLNSDNTGLIKSCAMRAGEYKIVETVKHLVKILNSDLSFDVKTSAVFALYQIQNEEALISLKKACLKNKCPYLKKTAELFLNYYLVNNPDKDIILDEKYLVIE